MAKVKGAAVKCVDDAWRHLMSAVAEQAIKDWLAYRDCDIEDRKKVLLRNDALNFLRGDKFRQILYVVAPNVQPKDVYKALDIEEETEAWLLPQK